MTKLEKKLTTVGACYGALNWASIQECSFQESWDNCYRGDWMLWLLNEAGSDRKKIILASCKIARTVLKYVPKEDKIPLESIEVTEAWLKGKAELSAVRELSNYYFKYDVSCRTNSSYAAYSTAYYACYYNTCIPCETAYYAANACFYNFLSKGNAHKHRNKSLLNSANIIRKFFQKPPRFYV